MRKSGSEYFITEILFLESYTALSHISETDWKAILSLTVAQGIKMNMEC